MKFAKPINKLKTPNLLLQQKDVQIQIVLLNQAKKLMLELTSTSQNAKTVRTTQFARNVQMYVMIMVKTAKRN